MGDWGWGIFFEGRLGLGMGDWGFWAVGESIAFYILLNFVNFLKKKGRSPGKIRSGISHATI
jgi:hypothetical protein